MNPSCSTSLKLRCGESVLEQPAIEAMQARLIQDMASRQVLGLHGGLCARRSQSVVARRTEDVIQAVPAGHGMRISATLKPRGR